jgi:hypothetical protein
MTVLFFWAGQSWTDVNVGFLRPGLSCFQTEMISGQFDILMVFLVAHLHF